jgi:anti-sigma B factor antagonist
MADKLRFSITERPDHVLVSVTGEIGATAENQFREALVSALRPEPLCLVVDLAQVPFMASSGVGVLLGIRGVLAARGGSLVLSSPCPAVARVLEVTGATDLIPVADHAEKAVTECAPGPGQLAG